MNTYQKELVDALKTKLEVEGWKFQAQTFKDTGVDWTAYIPYSEATVVLEPYAMNFPGWSNYVAIELNLYTSFDRPEESGSALRAQIYGLPDFKGDVEAFWTHIEAALSNLVKIAELFGRKVTLPTGGDGGKQPDVACEPGDGEESTGC